jgi:hypothetical protein
MNEMIHVIPDLDRKGLREFGLVTGGIIVGLFGLAFPWLFNFALPMWPWVVGGVLAAWALVAPDSLRSPYRVWMRFGLLLSRITTPIVMGAAFFLVIFPIGALMRLLGKDPLVREVDSGAQSYRVQSQKAPKKNMEKPF